MSQSISFIVAVRAALGALTLLLCGMAATAAGQDQAAEQFNAHWAAAAVFDINPDFYSEHGQAFILAMHKNQLADAYTVLLFDDLEQAKDSIKSYVDALRFLP